MANITKRGDTYRIRVSCGIDMNGRQIFKSTTFKPAAGMTERQVQKELQKRAMMFEDQCRNGIVGNDPRLTFAEFTKQFLAIKKDSLSPHTWEDYSQTLERIINPQIGNLKLAAIRPIHIQNLVKTLAEEPVTKRMKNGALKTYDRKRSPATVKRILAVVQSVMTQAVKLELIGTNPADSKKLTLPKAARPAVEIFTRQEAARMLECLDNEPLQYRVLIQLAVITGDAAGRAGGAEILRR